MNEELKKIREETESACRVERKREEQRQSDLKAFWAKEGKLLPEKLAMSKEIFQWGSKLLASEDYQYIRGVALFLPRNGLHVFGGSWGDGNDGGYGCSSSLALYDNGTFYYSKRAKWAQLGGFPIPDPETMAESLVYRYISEIREVASKGVGHTVTRIIERNRWYIRKGIERAQEVEG
jgi:hypothetical protein